MVAVTVGDIGLATVINAVVRDIESATCEPPSGPACRAALIHARLLHATNAFGASLHSSPARPNEATRSAAVRLAAVALRLAEEICRQPGVRM